MSRREEGRQNALTHEGAPADPVDDTNERGDDVAEVQQPDGTPVPRPDER